MKRLGGMIGVLLVVLLVGLATDCAAQGERWTYGQRQAYDDGFKYGWRDYQENLSRLHSRYKDLYDARTEPYFRKGYDDGYDGKPKDYSFGPSDQPTPTPTPAPAQTAPAGQVVGAVPLTIRCGSDDFGRKHCPADTRGGVRLLKQFSRAECREEETWGYDSKGIWVDKGCRAQFELIPYTENANIVVCASKNFRRNFCQADTSGGVKVARQFSDAACREDETWGYDNSGIWVDKGCGAQFELLPYTPTTPTRIVCSSDDRRRKVCPADTRRGVRLVRQLSKAKCDQGRTWGYTRGASAGIWVDKGCRAEFEAGRPAQAAVSTAPSVSDRIVTCESNDGRYKHCSTGSIQQAWLKRKLSKAACVENQTWGYDESGVWVDGGCRAEFTVRPR